MSAQTRIGTVVRSLDARRRKSPAAAKAWIAAALISAGITGLVDASPAIDTESPPAHVVGLFELGAPAESSFVIHATLPIPPGVYPRADGKLPFSIQDSNGTIVPAQIDIVSRYPDQAADGADVIELTARVHKPAGTTPGTRIQFAVVDHLHDATTFAKTSAVQSLLTTPDSVVIRARDVFGNLYKADLLDGADGTKLLRQGAWREQKRFYQAMRPVSNSYGPPVGPLRRLMLTHSYVSAWQGEDVVSLDLRVHNGSSGEDGQDPIDDPQTKLYFDALEIVVPQGWTLLPDVQDVGWGAPYAEGNTTVYPIVEQQPNGKQNVMPMLAQFHRRLTLSRPSSRPVATSLGAEAWQAFCQPGANAQGDPYYSWWNRETARYFPQRHVLPDFAHVGKPQILGNLNANYQADLQRLVSGLAGAYPFASAQLGWAYPYGNKYGGMTGGTDIILYDGVTTAWSGSNAGYRHYQLVHRTYTDRHRVVLYNKDGEPTRLSQWVIHGPNFDYVNMQFFLTLLSGPDPFGFNLAPQYQAQYAIAQGVVPGYETAMLQYHPIDIQHHIRYMRSPKVLVWLGNDQLAKDDLRMTAELLRLSYHDLPNNPNGAAVGNGMLSDINAVHAHPNVGFAFGRGEAWTVDGMCAAFAISDSAWRQEARPWFDTLTSLVRLGQSTCSGFIQAQTSPKNFNGMYRCRVSTETSMIEQSLLSMIETVYRGFNATKTNSLELVLEKSTLAMVQPPSWDFQDDGPIAIMAVGPASTSQPPFCGPPPSNGVSAGVDHYQSWSSFAYGFELSHNMLYLQRALDAVGGNNLLNSLKNAGTSNIGNRAGLLALAQELWGP